MKKIFDFLGTEVYIDNENYDTPCVIGKHIYKDKNEECVFSITNGSVIKGSFSDDLRYEDMREWIDLNNSNLMKLWENDNTDKIELEDIV